jgi:hypothetical protein
MDGIADPLRNKTYLRVRAKITSQNWRSDLVQIWLIRESKTTGIASYFADFASEVSAKDGLKLRCKNVKLFLREPLGCMNNITKWDCIKNLLNRNENSG